jgi:Concanavalin A-like lectin/glucanases superfamily
MSFKQVLCSVLFFCLILNIKAQSNSGYTFSPMSAFVAATSSNNFQITNQYTLEMWIKPLTVQPMWTNILHVGISDAVQPISIFMIPNSTALHIRTSTISNPNFGLDSPSLTLNSWNHLAVVFDAANNLNIIVNGVTVGSISGSALNFTSASPFYISSPWYPSSSVQLNELRLWNFAQNTIQIAASYNQKCQSPPQQGLVAYYGGPLLNPAVSVSITSGSQIICPNTSVTFTATATNGGPNPRYQWQKNGINIGSNSIVNTFTTSSLVDGDVISCILSNVIVCGATANSTGIPITVNSGTRLYVNNANNSGFYDGNSWSTAYTNLQDALSKALSCPSISEIWVAKGTYKPTATATKTISFNIPTNVKVYGGFGGWEVNLSDRIYNLIHSTNLTTLSGDLNGNDTNASTSANDNSITVVKFNNVSNTTRLDGFTISGGYNPTSSNGAQSGNGAGISNFNSSPQIANCIITRNNGLYGGGIYILGGSPVFNNCQIYFNNKIDGGFPGYGGGLCNYSGNPILNNCIFHSNTALYGGAIYNQSDLSINLTLNNCSFSGNFAGSGAAILNFGAGNQIVVNLTNCIFFGSGANTIFKAPSSFSPVANIANYCLFDNTVTGYTGLNNLTTTNSPFVSATDLHIPCNSPAINSGTNTNAPMLDLDGNIRPSGGIFIDMGAYEMQETTTWLGNSDNWSDPANWSGKIVPNTCNNLIINNGVSFFPKLVGLNNICKKLTINEGAKVDLEVNAKLNITSN